MLKVMYVLTGLDYAGAETQVKDLALALNARGHIVEIVSLTAPRAFTCELAAAGIRVIDLGMTREQRGPIALAGAILRLRGYVKAFKPQIVHSHMVHANLLSRTALAFYASAPLVCTAHSTIEGGALRDWAYRLTNWTSTLDTTVSHSATDRFLRARVFRRQKTLTVHNGLDLTKFCSERAYREVTHGVFRWIAVGRLHESKDYPTLFSALRGLPNATVDIAGRGELHNALLESARNAGVADRVNFLGLRKDLHNLLPQYDGFVLSSAWEGFGLVVAEAMASGLPVVATTSGGPQEIIGDDEVAGLLVAPRNSASLATAMQRIMDMNAQQRQIMGAAGRMRVAEQFNMPIIVNKWLEIYSRLVANKRLDG